MLQFTSEVEKRDSVELGTVRQIIGEDGRVEFEPRNFVGSARLIVHLVKGNGQKAKVICSPTVSKLFRKMEMSLGELLSLSIFEETAKDGNIINVIEMPENTQENVGYDVKNIEEKTFVPEEIEFVPEENILL